MNERRNKHTTSQADQFITNLGFSAGSPVFSAFLGSSLPCLGCIRPVNARTDRADKWATRRSASLCSSAQTRVGSGDVIGGRSGVSTNCKVCSKKGEFAHLKACDFRRWSCFFIKEIILLMHNFFSNHKHHIIYNVAYK